MINYQSSIEEMYGAFAPIEVVAALSGDDLPETARGNRPRFPQNGVN